LSNSVASGAATIAGGVGNQIAEVHIGLVPRSYGAIGGGASNLVNAGYGTIGGGLSNNVSGAGGFIGGGGYDGSSMLPNKVSGAGSVVVGGTQNIASGSRSSVGGGHNNTATNNYATVPGGAWNCAGGSGSFAAGQAAKAYHDGAFVWSDSWTPDVVSTNANSVTMRASGGYRLFSNNGMTAGVYLAPGGGGWTAMSDRNSKEAVQPVDAQQVLEKVAKLPVSTWKYKAQDESVRHIGPMAQDFKAAFGVGETDTGITTVDADGVALAAIQGLNQKLKAKDAELEQLKRRLNDLEQAFRSLAASK
jgi:hypothetical protein